VTTTTPTQIYKLTVFDKA